MTTLDRETMLRRGAEPDRASLPVSDVYRNISGVAFGGWTMAAAMEALQTHPQARGQVLTLNATFLDGLVDGDAHVRTRLLGRKKRTDFWRVEIYKDAAEQTLAFAADAVASLERPADISFQTPPPISSPPAETPLFSFPGGPKWLRRFELRPLRGRPFQDGDTPYSLGWIRDAEDRPLDRKALAALCDTPLPRIFFLSSAVRIVSTFCLTMTICADQAGIAAAGTDPILIESNSDRLGESRFHQRTRLWSARGDMLALSEQVAVYGKPMGG